MRWLNGLWLRFRGFVSRDRLDRDLEDELNFHLQMRQRELETSGMGTEEAGKAARRRFGSKEAVADTGRDLLGFGPVDRFFKDVQHGWRLLLKNRGVTLIAVLSLGLGIGGNTTIFSVIHSVLLQPPPYADPEELITIWGADLARGRSRNMVAFADVLDWQSQARSFGGLAVAGMLNTLAQLLRVRVGYDPSSIITMQIDFAGEQYVEIINGRSNAVRRIHPRLHIAYDQILERVRSLPGVESASLVTWLPQAGNNRGPRGRRFQIGGQAAAPGEQPSALYNMIAPDYFETMRVPVLRGRVFSPRDTQSAQWVAVINETAARRFWPDGNALGQLITARTVGTAEEERPREIVGIVGDIRQSSLAREPSPEIYVPYAQQPPVYGDGWQALMHRNLVVRTTGDPEKLAAAVRSEVVSIDRSQPAYGLASMEEVISSSAGYWRFYLNLLSIFGGIALFLAAIGIYGVISYLVSERTLEFGIRMAVGGAPGHVWRIVFRDAFSVVGAGLTIGLAASVALTPALASFLYGVKPHDPLTLAGAVILLSLVACLAILNPARKATRIDPARALRSS